MEMKHDIGTLETASTQIQSAIEGLDNVQKTLVGLIMADSVSDFLTTEDSVYMKEVSQELGLLLETMGIQIAIYQKTKKIIDTIKADKEKVESDLIAMMKG